MKKLVKYLAVIAVCGMIYIIFKEVTFFPSIRNLFKSQPIRVEATPVVIREIKSISELVTIVYADEVVMTKTKRGKGLPSLITTGNGVMMMPDYDKLVIIGRGKVIAGVNLQKLDSSMISIVKDSIFLQLPKAEILSTIVNPSGYETFVEDGDWLEDEVIALKLSIQNEIAKRAVEQNVLNLAITRAESVLTKLLENLGFKKVKVVSS